MNGSTGFASLAGTSILASTFAGPKAATFGAAWIFLREGFASAAGAGFTAGQTGAFGVAKGFFMAAGLIVVSAFASAR
ncbi:MAG TPA: hypothetical protein VN873_01380 [Candidatus Angelobacter sp.]|nr:hypothetical protein [Candidatus Angelobacter sp.]